MKGERSLCLCNRIYGKVAVVTGTESEVSPVDSLRRVERGVKASLQTPYTCHTMRTPCSLKWTLSLCEVTNWEGCRTCPVSYLQLTDLGRAWMTSRGPPGCINPVSTAVTCQKEVGWFKLLLREGVPGPDVSLHSLANILSSTGIPLRWTSLQLSDCPFLTLHPLFI